jgi:uncharacterized protein
METIKDIDRLRDIVGEPSPTTRHKFYHTLTPVMKEFIALSPIAMLSTADSSGSPTVSPKGDFPGFARVENDTNLLVPERKGNRLIFSLQNILQNPKVSLLFIVPGTNETLRVDGDAELISDKTVCSVLSTRGRPAILVTKVSIKKCYFHCGKAFLRSSLWSPESWPAPVMISFGAQIGANLGKDQAFAQELDARVAESYQRDL